MSMHFKLLVEFTGVDGGNLKARFTSTLGDHPPVVLCEISVEPDHLPVANLRMAVAALLAVLAYADTIGKFAPNYPFSLMIDHPHHGPMSGKKYVETVLAQEDPDVLEALKRLVSGDIPSA